MNINYLKNLPHILWINMERSKDRKEYMENLFKHYNIYNHTRIDAIDGNNINTQEINNKVSKNVYATLLSHLKSLQYYVDNVDKIGKYCMIVEDDFSFDYTKYWKKSFEEYFMEFPDDWEILKLFNNYENLSDVPKNISIRNLKDHKTYGTNCYIIKYKTAIKILEKYKDKTEYHKKQPFFFVADRGMYESVNVYSLPLFTFRDDNDSNIILCKAWISNIQRIKDKIKDIWMNM